jgi:hypothetical protein
MPTPEESKKAGVSDVADWAEADIASAYPPGTKFDLGDGKPIVFSKVPDAIGGAPARRSNKRPRKGRKPR